MEQIKQTFLKYWFAVSAVALAILYYMFQNRGRALSEAHEDAQRNLLAQQLVEIHNQSQRSDTDAQAAALRFYDLRERHGDLLVKLGLDSRTGESNQTH